MNKTVGVALVTAVLAGTACAGHWRDAPPNPSTTKETAMSQGPGSSRPPPPGGAPVLHDGIRYEEDADSERFGATQSSGYLVAIDAASGKRLWMLKVYEVPTDPDAPFQLERHFRSMRLGAGGNQLEIESEAGGKYVVDLGARTSTWISGPDSVHQRQISP